MYNYVYYKYVIVCVYFVCTPTDKLRMGVVTKRQPKCDRESGGGGVLKVSPACALIVNK